MKKKLLNGTTFKVLTLGLLFCFTSCSILQLNDQNAEVTLFFKDGTTKEGFGNRKGTVYMKFKENGAKRYKKYHFNELKKATIKEDGLGIDYFYLLVKRESRFVVVQEISRGKISMFKSVAKGQHFMGNAGFGSNGVGFTHVAGYDIEEYFVRRKGEYAMVNLGSTSLFSKNFKKAASTYFKDCPKLVAKIQIREFMKKDIEAIVDFYNSECQKKSQE